MTASFNISIPNCVRVDRLNGKVAFTTAILLVLGICVLAIPFESAYSQNQPPTINQVPDTIINEYQGISLTITASDPESATTISSSQLPTGATFLALPYTNRGDLTWSFLTVTPPGVYPITFYATDNSSAVDSFLLRIFVLDPLTNDAPFLYPTDDQNGIEGNEITVPISAIDGESNPTLSVSPLPSGASFVDSGNGQGVLTWTPSFVQSGTYSILAIATDDSSETVSEYFDVIIADAGNHPPELSSIGNQSTTENVLLSFEVEATDPEDTPVLTVSDLLSGASFVDHGNGSGTFSWTPTYTQSGVYPVTFYATDDSTAVDSEQISISVIEAGNQPPVLASIGPHGTTENINLNFSVSATDPDSTTPSLSAAGLPTGATFTDNGNGTGSFQWIPDYTDAGSYNVNFISTDGYLSDSELVEITVFEAGNQAPVLAAIGDRNTTENVNLTFGVSASDPDGTTPSLVSINLPSAASFIDHGNGTGTFDWTPNFTDAGSTTVTFITSDGVLSDSETVTVTIFEAGNQPPAVTPVATKTTTENVQLTFDVLATDPDSTIPAISIIGTPAGATFVDHGDGSATFQWTPDFTQAGNYNVSFYASDGVISDTVDADITVNEAGNQPPVLASIGSHGTTENTNLNFSVSATDPDGTTPSLSVVGLPSGAGFTDNGNGIGNFDWTPGFTDAGTYNLTFIASDDSLADSEAVVVIVYESGNQAPILVSIGDTSTTENVLLTFNISASDPDGTTPVLSASNLPSAANFVDNSDGTGTFSWTPSYSDAGNVVITFFASDGVLKDSELVNVTVLDAGNQRPEITPISVQTTTENVYLTFTVIASDPDETLPTISTIDLPDGAAFSDNGDGTGTFEWTPGYTQSGSYNVSFVATDGVLSDTAGASITVNDAGNQPPILTAIGPHGTTENANLNFSISASDPDGTTPSLGAVGLPSGAAFADNGNGSGNFDWTPGFADASTYNVTFIAADGALADSEVVVITVVEAGNQSPELTAINDKSTTENVNLTFNIYATDPDGTTPAFTAISLPSTATFADSGNGTATFEWTPGYSDGGEYEVTFIAADGALADSETVTITVLEAGNQVPVLAEIGARSTTENIQLTFAVSATDPDGTTPAFTTDGLPAGADFIDNGNGTGTFDWTPGFVDAGIYNISFIATDSELSDSETVTITVNEAGNQVPVLAPIEDQTITENSNLYFTISATDAESIPELITSSLPTGSSFIDHGDGTGTFDWTPTYTQSGIYPITFHATDDSAATVTRQIALTVNDAGNQPPVLSSIGSKGTEEGVTLNFNITAADPDETIPTLSAIDIPSGASFTDSSNGVGNFDWTPTFVQSGIYGITFIASDGELSDSEYVTVVVNDPGNQRPVLATIGDKSTTEGNILTFTITATDPDSTIPAILSGELPVDANFQNNGDGSAEFTWTPSFVQAGSYNVSFFATDGILSDTEVVQITVLEAGNQQPVLALIDSQYTTEGTQLTFSITATDSDDTVLSIFANAPPPGATLIDNGNGTAVFDWTPGFTQSGTYDIAVIATDGDLADSGSVSITVFESGNQPPVLAEIGPRSVAEGDTLLFDVLATDPDSTIPALSASPLPTGADFTDNGDGRGMFIWTPDFSQYGVYSITFVASDGILADSETIQISISDAGNQCPILSPVDNQTITEGDSLFLVLNATDPDGTTPAINGSMIPSGATLTNNGDGTANFVWNPSYLQSGNYDVLFLASDGVLSDSELVQITVIDAGNQLPVLVPIGTQRTTEGQPISFTVVATDADGSPPILSTSTLATGSNLTNNGNGTGTFYWIPSYTQSGTYSVTFYAADDSAAVDSDIVAITVNEAGNQSPVLDSVGNFSLVEGDSLSILVSASDAESVPTISLDPIPSDAAFVDSGNGSASFTWVPLYTQAGVYTIQINATDDSGTVASEVVKITVAESTLGLGGLAGTASNYPNPFEPNEGATTFAFHLSEPGRVTIEIFTIMGNRVSTIVNDAQRPAGPNSTDTWDGKNESGRTVASGTYLCQITVTYDSGRTERTHRKVTVLR